MSYSAADARFNLKSWFLNAIDTSHLISQAVPYVRRSAIYESVAASEKDEDVLQLLLECLSGSPYIPDPAKAELAELALTNQWDALSNALQCRKSGILDALSHSIVTPFLRFRVMVITIFTRSKKVQTLPAARRHGLGCAILTSSSMEELVEITLAALSSSTIFDESARSLIADDIFERRYDRLLLSDRFDCDILTRQQHRYVDRQPTVAITNNPSAPPLLDEQECPVCLGTNLVSARTVCNHYFCRPCIEGWAAQHDSCPVCRASLRVDQLHDTVIMEETTFVSEPTPRLSHTATATAALVPRAEILRNTSTNQPSNASTPSSRTPAPQPGRAERNDRANAKCVCS